jgi:hypothetical protein
LFYGDGEKRTCSTRTGTSLMRMIFVNCQRKTVQWNWSSERESDHGDSGDVGFRGREEKIFSSPIS